ncbi:MAG: hypothetical protein U0Q11_28175, partial [Vicinamibacterales bacterium]
MTTVSAARKDDTSEHSVTTPPRFSQDHSPSVRIGKIDVPDVAFEWPAVTCVDGDDRSGPPRGQKSRDVGRDAGRVRLEDPGAGDSSRVG